MGALDLVDWPADRTLALSGSAGALRLPITLSNNSDAPAQVEEASLADVRLAGAGVSLRADPVPVQFIVAPQGVGKTQVRLRLDSATPPGRYEGQVKLAGLTRSVTIDVLPEVKLEVRPAPLVVDAALGLHQTLAVSFQNRGNVPLTVDVSGRYPLAEEAAVASERLQNASQGGNPLAAILDKMTGRGPAPVLIPFGVLELAMADGPAGLAPGASVVTNVSLRLPTDLSPTARYHTFAPVYATDLHVVAVTAAKPHAAAPSRTTGAPA